MLLDEPFCPIIERKNTCGHPEIKHYAKEMCKECYIKNYYKYKIYLSTVKDSFNKELPDGGSEAQQPTGGQL